ncbi:MAG: PIG-L family deacetylase [Candidatus Bathyarchaeia archaeon]
MSDKKIIIIFAPHPDDETFGCGGTIAKKISEGYEVYVVFMTDGRYAFLNVLGIEEDPTPEQLKEIRMEEVKKATKILGIPESNLIFLNFVDGTLKDNVKEAEERVVNILREKSPCEIYFPYKWDGHRDHRVTHKIVKNGIRKLGISPACYQYSITPGFARFGRFIDTFLNFIFRIDKVYVDISDFLQLKKIAIVEFKSELTIISARQHKSVMINVEKFQKDREMFYVEKTL